MSNMREIDYDSLSKVADSHFTILERYFDKFPVQAVMSLAWAGALNAMYNLRSYPLACSAKWPVRTHEEIGDRLLSGESSSGYFGYAADVSELAEALVQQRLPEQLHYCVGFDNLTIFDPWCGEVMKDYESSCDAKWPETLRLPKYIVGRVDELLRTHDYHYEIHIPVSSGMNALVSELAGKMSSKLP